MSDRLMQLAGIALLAFIAIALVTGVLAAMNPDIGTAGPSQTEWSVERVNESHVQLAYEAGPAIPSDEIVVSVDGYQRHGIWSEQVLPGDRGAVSAAENQLVRIYWSDGEGPRDLLFERRV